MAPWEFRVGSFFGESVVVIGKEFQEETLGKNMRLRIFADGLI
jgi:hypothetical protein